MHEITSQTEGFSSQFDKEIKLEAKETNTAKRGAGCQWGRTVSPLKGRHTPQRGCGVTVASLCSITVTRAKGLSIYKLR